jgi:hypothetical protein
MGYRSPCKKSEPVGQHPSLEENGKPLQCRPEDALRDPAAAAGYRIIAGPDMKHRGTF